jgi:hypothetical protein
VINSDTHAGFDHLCDTQVNDFVITSDTQGKKLPLRENYFPMMVNDLIVIADNTYSRHRILGMEKSILNRMVEHH